MTFTAPRPSEFLFFSRLSLSLSLFLPQNSTSNILCECNIRLPIKNGLVDWDCPESIDIPAMAQALSYIRENASFPVRNAPINFISKDLP